MTYIVGSISPASQRDDQAVAVLQNAICCREEAANCHYFVGIMPNFEPTQARD
jgi:hypothetical protein